MANGERLNTWDKVFLFCCVSFLAFTIVMVKLEPPKIPLPSVELASMGFTVFNITETRLSAKWDLSIRIPQYLPRFYRCFQGDFHASFLYKNVTIATSSQQKYDNLQYYHPQYLAVSAVVLEKDICGLIGQEIMDDIREKKEVKFGLRFFLSDCRQNTTGIMSFACNEAVLRFEPGSEMKATVFGNHPSCINF